MIFFNEREKDFLRSIAEINHGYNGTFERFLQDNIFTIDKGIAPCILSDNNSDNSEESQVLLFVESNCWHTPEIIHKKIFDFLEIVSLIDYLVKNRYIILFPIYPNNDIPVRFISSLFDPVQSDETNSKLNLGNYHMYYSDFSRILNADNEESFKAITFKESESNIYDIVINSMTGIILVTEKLRSFVRNEFKTSEQLRFEQQFDQDKADFETQKVQFEQQLEQSKSQFIEQKEQYIKQIEIGRSNFKKQQIIAWIAIIISFVTGAFSAALSIYNSSQISVVELGSDQADQFRTILDNLNRNTSNLNRNVVDNQKNITENTKKIEEIELSNQKKTN